MKIGIFFFTTKPTKTIYGYNGKFIAKNYQFQNFLFYFILITFLFLLFLLFLLFIIFIYYIYY